jgi:hypothetical protein
MIVTRSGKINCKSTCRYVQQDTTYDFFYKTLVVIGKNSMMKFKLKSRGVARVKSRDATRVEEKELVCRLIRIIPNSKWNLSYRIQRNINCYKDMYGCIDRVGVCGTGGTWDEDAEELTDEETTTQYSSELSYDKLRKFSNTYNVDSVVELVSLKRRKA